MKDFDKDDQNQTKDKTTTLGEMCIEGMEAVEKGV